MTSASTAPAARARLRMVSKSPPWPTSTARAMTSQPHSSPIHRTATDVSSPPEYARTTRAPTLAPLLRFEPGEAGQAGRHLLAPVRGRADDQDGVVAGHGAEDVGQAGPVEGRGHHVGRTRRR